ncbi:MAG: outer membrane beta-barrel protein [Bacteroidia bacterium]
MKKTRLLIMALLAVMTFPGKGNAQALEEGNIAVDVYYGFPNLFKSVVETTYANSGSEENVEIGGIGPMGMRGEYMVSDDVGIGLEVNYTNTVVSYEESSINSFGEFETYTYEVSVPRLRIMPRFSIHFGNSDNFDFYGAVAAGYNSTKFKFKTNDPNEEFDEEVKSPLPVAFRIAIGGRYYFADLVGINMEIGLGGGALVCGGLSLRIQ